MRRMLLTEFYHEACAESIEWENILGKIEKTAAIAAARAQKGRAFAPHSANVRRLSRGNWFFRARQPSSAQRRYSAAAVSIG